jgi:hypothetical protein
MAFTRVNPGGWPLGALLTSTQMNSLDTNVSNAIDNRVGALDIAARPTVQRYSAMPPVAPVPASWTLTGHNAITTVNTLATLYWMIAPPNGSTITAMFVWLKGAGGHGALPGTMPTLQAFKVATDSTVTVLQTVTDSSGTTGVYQAPHTMNAGSLSEVVDNTAFRYGVAITTEAVSNNLSGATYMSCGYICALSKLDEV